MFTWLYGHMAVWSYGCMVNGCMVIWLYGQSWLYGHIWLYGQSWMYGRMTVWLYGYGQSWMYRRSHGCISLSFFIRTPTSIHKILVIGAETAPTLVQLEFFGGRGDTPLTPVCFYFHTKHVVAC